MKRTLMTLGSGIAVFAIVFVVTMVWNTPPAEKYVRE